MKIILNCIAFSTLGLATACGPIRVPGAASQSEPEMVSAPEEIAAPPAQAVVEVAEVTITRAEIDWQTARQDFADRSGSGDDGTFAIAGGAGAPPVPVLLPDMPVMAASVGDGPGVQFRPMTDGYFAVYPGEDYDIIINGTDRLVSAPGRGSVATDTELRFENTMTGSQISFSRYGASYLVEFACKGAAAISEAGCISEADAKAVVEDLLLAGTQ